MKKIITSIILSTIIIPAFSLTLKVGDETSYLPTKEAKKETVVTKIAQVTESVYELQLLSDSIIYTYSLKNGDPISLFGKKNAKAKTNTEMKFVVKDVTRNVIQLEAAVLQDSSSDAK